VKTFFVLLAISCVLASAVLIKLTREGISIRSAPIIAPSPQGARYSNIAKSLLNRLFPDFQMSNYLVIGRSTGLEMAEPIISDLKTKFEEQFQKTVTLLADDGNLSADAIAKCAQPCWILTSETEANELSGAQKIPLILNSMENTNHFHITLIPFFNVPEPTQNCIDEKRLTLGCLVPLSIHEVSKKFKDKNTSYFFMRKYKDRDYFLFLQTGQLNN
jgi:hypothetical protein